MDTNKSRICHILNSIGWTLLVCSLAVNYMLYNGKIIRPEWVQDYVSVLSGAADQERAAAPAAPEKHHGR